jgi:hypothetical protein
MQPEKLSGEELVRLALSGLRRIAFGPACDPVRIALCENSPSPTELAQMDLFLISEIKRPKEGSCEIKFHDRMKAMEMLIAYGERHSGSGVQGILDALSSNGDFGEASAV